MDRTQRQAAKRQLVEAMDHGQSWHTAAVTAGIHLSRATAYRLRQRVAQEGETALVDRRQGHVHKLHAPVRQWMVATCQAAPHTPSHQLQTAIRELFAVTISIGYLNQVRASLGIRYQRPHQEKKVM